MVPLWFLAVSSVLNIILDIWFVAGMNRGVGGAAEATVIAQAVSGIGIAGYTILKSSFSEAEKRAYAHGTGNTEQSSSVFYADLCPAVCDEFRHIDDPGLVNSFGTVIMAAFAVAVKIDTLAYMLPRNLEMRFLFLFLRITEQKDTTGFGKASGLAVKVSAGFCVAVSVLVWIFAAPLIRIFLSGAEPEIVCAGVHYLHIEGAFYWGIGCLFLLYGLYRGIERPVMSLILTVLSLGTRVALAYLFAPMPQFGVSAIWWAIPVGWILADLAGFLYYKRIRNRLGAQHD